MKIAQISPLYEPCPPVLYGGTERVVSFLTEELVRKGHDVTLFASGDSKTSAHLISPVCKALRLDPKVEDPLAHHIVQLKQVIDRAHEFDILHFHTDYLHFPVSPFLRAKNLVTLHGRLNIPDLLNIYSTFKKQPLVSISNSQRNLLPVQANWLGTVYHGLPLDFYTMGSHTEDYVVFLARISPEKRPDRAVEIARKAGINIKIAAKIDRADQHYYRSVKEILKQEHVEFLGEVGEDQKEQLLRHAKALLFPIDWPEPFGIAMIEAMACGTPVIAYNHGSIPEVVDHGITGFVVNSIDEAVKAIKDIDRIDRSTVRKVFEERFSASVMTDNYLRLYEQLLNGQNTTTKSAFLPSASKLNSKLAS
jgi:glycosyltransferase involved in cell wall biosynthesis